MKTSVFDEAIHSFGAPPRFPSAGALTDIVFKMAPAYKFALIQMQPKVSQSVASYLQRALIVSPIYTGNLCSKAQARRGPLHTTHWRELV